MLKMQMIESLRTTSKMPPDLYFIVVLLAEVTEIQHQNLALLNRNCLPGVERQKKVDPFKRCQLIRSYFCQSCCLCFTLLLAYWSHLTGEADPFLWLHFSINHTGDSFTLKSKRTVCALLYAYSIQSPEVIGATISRPVTHWHTDLRSQGSNH